MPKARIAVIGTGWWATTAHLPALAANPDAELVAICDQRSDLLERVADRFHAPKSYTDYREMLQKERPDGVVISVWAAAHFEVARECLKRGLHVLVEKPLVLEAKHARDLVELARAQERELIVGYPWHYCERARQARQAVQNGDLGSVRYVNCYFASTVIDFLRGNDEVYGQQFPYALVGPGSVYSDPKRSGGGQGQLQVTHAAALVFFITGLRPAEVFAWMDKLDVQVDVVDAIVARMEGGALVNIGSTGNLQISDPGTLTIQVNCDRGWIDFNFMTGAGKIRHADGRETLLPALDSEPPPPGVEQGEQIYPMSAPVTNLIQIILGADTNQSPGEIGWHTVELLDAAYRSAEADGKLIRIKSLYE